MYRRGWHAGRLLHSARRTSGRSTGANGCVRMPLSVNIQNNLLNQGLSGTRSTCDDDQSVLQRRPDCRLLFGCQLQLQKLFLRHKVIVHCFIGVWQAVSQTRGDSVCQMLFCFGSLGTVHHVTVDCKLTVPQQLCRAVRRKLSRQCRRIQQFDCRIQKTLFGQTQMPAGFRFGQRIKQTLVDAFGRQSVQLHPHGNPICRVESDPCHFT